MARPAVLSVLLLYLCQWVCLTQADLRADLRDFMALVPQRRIAHIAARRSVFDPRFRQASKYLRSDEFVKLWRQMCRAPDFADLVDYVSEYGSGYDVSGALNKLPTGLRNFQLPEEHFEAEEMQTRDLTTFLREVMTSLPRAQIALLMRRKVQEGGQFARLYGALRQAEFRELVKAARHSPDLKAPLGRLSINHINVDDIIKMAYELISWGPELSASAARDADGTGTGFGSSLSRLDIFN